MAITILHIQWGERLFDTLLKLTKKRNKKSSFGNWYKFNSMYCFKVQSHHQNALRELLGKDINTLIKQNDMDSDTDKNNTLIKQSDTDITELTEIVGGKLQQELT